jgi:hypothetical protein
VDAARARFKMAKQDAKGAPLEAHYRQLERTMPGFKRPQLPAIPETLAHVWAWFCDLDAGRAGKAPISWSDLKAWAELTGRTPRPWEVHLLRKLDRVRLEVARG